MYYNETNIIIKRATKDKENPYVSISKKILDNNNLSWKAKGLLCYILSLPNGWVLHLNHLSKQSIDREKSTRSALNELYENNYLQRYPYYINGRISKWEYEVSELGYCEEEKIKYIKIEGNKKNVIFYKDKEIEKMKTNKQAKLKNLKYRCRFSQNDKEGSDLSTQNGEEDSDLSSLNNEENSDLHAQNGEEDFDLSSLNSEENSDLSAPKGEEGSDLPPQNGKEDSNLLYQNDKKSSELFSQEVKVAIINVADSLLQNNNTIINNSTNKSIYQSNIIEGRNNDELQAYFNNMGINKLQTEPEEIEALKEVITHLYYSNKLKVGNSEYPSDVIRSKISKLNIFNLEYVLNSYHQVSKTTEIKNPLMYMCSCIFNSLSNTKFGIEAKANFDLNNSN